ncbi:MAG TPA: hypothetical protein VKP67_03745 [Xanthobacteraceae bacterium]|nr:hypothetical protein [Xanthobacteraceae bacterium]
MQSTTLIVRVSAAVLVLSAAVVDVMMVHVSDFATLTKVGSYILLVLEGMLDMDADQRHHAGGLGEKK